MAHLHNRTSFRWPATLGPAIPPIKPPPLLESYTSLVAIELTLKDELPTAPDSHDIADLAEQFIRYQARNPIPPAFTRLREAIRQCVLQMTQLKVSSQRGEMRVPRHSYPYLRYLRHRDDFTGGVETVAVERLALSVRAVQRELDACLVLIHPQSVPS